MKHIVNRHGIITREGITLPDGSQPLPPNGNFTITLGGLCQDFKSIDAMIDEGWAID